VIDPITAYQITTMLQGVTSVGTAATVSSLGRPIAGKTGTTNDYRSAWFVGYTPSLVAGLYIGYDTPSTLGRGGTGGALAAPIFNEFMQAATKNQPPEKFQVPAGMTMVAVNRATGMAAQPGEPNAIMEAFKPGTGPATSLQVIGGGDAAAQVAPEEILRTSPQANQAVTSGAGGLF
jgi:penicillin-binding protein 1A